MGTLTVNQARRILGKEAQGVSDSEIEADIETAILLKDLFFAIHTKQPKEADIRPPACSNVP